MTDDAILAELGARLAAHRLRKNITQEDAANAIGISRLTYSHLENGKGKLNTLVAAMRLLDCLDTLDALIVPPQFSPIQARKLKGKERKRATSKPHTNEANHKGDW